MASTKARTAIWAAQALVAAEADTTSDAVNLTAGYGASLNIRLTNGATGPTVAAQVQIRVSADGTSWWNFGGALRGGVANSGVYEWGGIDIPAPVMYVRLVAGSNTGQDVTVDADISQITAV